MALVDRSGAVALMPEDVSMALIKEVTNYSLAMTAFEDIPMTRGQTRMPVISALPMAYFVGADTGQKQTTQMDWKNKYMNAEELACIVPIPEAVAEDVEGDVWTQIEPKVRNAIARTLDAAVLFGEGAPATWPENIVAAAKAVGNEVKSGTASKEEGSLANDIAVLIGKLEEQGFDFNFAAAQIGLKTKLRNARDTLGQKLTEFATGGENSLYEQPLVFPARGLWPSGAGTAQAVLIEKEQFVIGIRTDIEMKMLDQAVIQAPDGSIMYNLAQDDMVALRIRFRCGWEIGNQITYDQPNEALRYAAAVLTH
jgi:HK97 family phage major capsid protein